jgi:hypothetical protein
MTQIDGKTRFCIFLLGLYGIVGWGFLAFFVIQAYLNEDWIIGLDFNHYGEGIYELIAFPALLIIMILCFIYVLIHTER